MNDLIPNLNRLLGVGRTVESRIWLKEGHWDMSSEAVSCHSLFLLLIPCFLYALKTSFSRSPPAMVCQSETSEMEPKVEPPILNLLSWYLV